MSRLAEVTGKGSDKARWKRQALKRHVWKDGYDFLGADYKEACLRAAVGDRASGGPDHDSGSSLGTYGITWVLRSQEALEGEHRTTNAHRPCSAASALYPNTKQTETNQETPVRDANITSNSTVPKQKADGAF